MSIELKSAEKAFGNFRGSVEYRIYDQAVHAANLSARHYLRYIFTWGALLREPNRVPQIQRCFAQEYLMPFYEVITESPCLQDLKLSKRDIVILDRGKDVIHRKKIWVSQAKSCIRAFNRVQPQLTSFILRVNQGVVHL